MTIKKIISIGVLAAGLCSVPLAAQAGLTIVNNTDKDSTSIINDGMCSSSLSGGITKAHSTNKVSDIIIGFACYGHASDCKADVYMTDNCSGDKVATVMFDTKKGIYDIKNVDTTKFKISGSGFTVNLDSGSALAVK
ncbi:hypothetical protein AQUSIP_11770 [Aquicella siphonis]|uniref:Uncharacterized protein n=1 Tax=Aquicella siphonis TaxID=254247 RepID=A0A5E4PHS3_9COXI|nr:hypothetical protein [Aquicella siphonis]VVC75876.1 hypothetical protein AQUSIP_11770 [Aquicella siphonis]